MTKVHIDMKLHSAAGKIKNTNNAIATPKTSKGKIAKNRYKGEVKDHNDYVNRYYDIQSSIRLCFVKMNRYNTTQKSKYDASIAEKNCATNQYIDCSEKHIDSNSSIDNLFPTLTQNVKTSLPKQSDGNNNNNTYLHAGMDFSPHSLLDKTDFSDQNGQLNHDPKLQLQKAKKCFVRLKKIRMPKQNDKDKNHNKYVDYKLGNKSKSAELSKLNDGNTNVTFSNCVVRIHEFPISTSNGQTENLNIYEDQQKPSTFQDKNIINQNESLTKKYKSIRNCVVKLVKLPTCIQKDLNDRFAAKESILASQIISPTLDNEKRKAFQKLSLSFQQNSKKNDILIESDSVNYSKSEECPKNNEELRCFNPKLIVEKAQFEEENLNAKHVTCFATQNNVKNTNCNNHQKVKRIRIKNNVNETTIEVKQLTKDGPKNCTKITKAIKKIKSKKVNSSRQKINAAREKTCESLPCKKPISNSKYINIIRQKNSMVKVIDDEKNHIGNNIRKIDSAEPKKVMDKNICNEEKNICLKSIIPAVKSLKYISFPKQKLAVGKENNNTTSSILEFHPQRNSTMSADENRLQMMESVGYTVDNTEKDGTTNSHTLTENQTKTSNKTNKFFHRAEYSNRNHFKVSNCKNPRAGKKSSLVRREKVYDFLSQSQSSDCDAIADADNAAKVTKSVDPTADIIKKLIAEGKVAVATSKKGTGKTVFKRNRKKTTKDVLNNCNKPNGIKKHRKNIKISKKVSHITSEDFVDDFANEHFMDNDPNSIQTPLETASSRHTYLDQEGTFSNLARSVLINQAKRNDPQRLKAQRLLSLAKKLISTPNNKNIPSIRTTINVDISPIQTVTTLPRNVSKASPWRIDEDAHMPKVFNFSRSSGNLPSYSSDFIPPTPKKDKTNKTIDRTKIADAVMLTQARNSKSAVFIPQEDGIRILPNTYSTPLPSHSVNSSIPSFSSNDSNAENKTPPGVENLQTNDENANIFNLKQLPNPRRALNYRSPLKTINITEVVHLPQLEMSKILNLKKHLETGNIKESEELFPVNETQEDLFGFEDFLTQNDASKQGLRGTDLKDTVQEIDINRTIPANQPKEDLFGFEEFLTQNEISSQEEFLETENVNVGKDPKAMFQQNRLKLRKLKPDTRELEKSLQENSISNEQRTNKILFIDENHIPSKTQRTLKEMLCSTMIHDKPTTTGKTEGKQCKIPNQYQMDEESNESAMLFKDLEPETTFNEDDPHRTYIRPFKRKRRLNENRLIFALESDESDIEENPETILKIEKKNARTNQSHDTDTSAESHLPPNKKKNAGKNQSHETDTSKECHAPPNKKKKRQAKDKPELVNFVEEFNEMCKEVENYTLIVEKSV